jgi:hypothetical protein
VKEKTRLHANIVPGKENWIGAGAGRAGLTFVYSITQHTTTVSLIIDRGSSDENRAIFNALAESKQDVERAFGDTLEWSQIDNRRSCHILKQFTLGGWRDEAKWTEIQNAMIDAMIRLEKALKPHIDRLRV